MEHNSTDFDTTLLNQLEGITTDPLIERLFAKAREIEEMVNYTGDTTEEERQALVAELDAMWPYDQMSLNVSGRLTFLDTEEDEASTKYYDETPMISNGFVLASKSELQNGNGDGKDEYRVALYFLKYDDASATTGKFGTGLLDDITIDYPVQSIEMIENRLRYFSGDLMQDIDHIILNCNTEEEAVVALRDFSLNIDTSSPEDLLLLRDVQNYMNSLLEFDRELPYRIQMGGDCYVQDEGIVKPAVADVDSTGLVGVNGIQFMPENFLCLDGVKRKVLPCIDTKFFSVDKESLPANILVPARSVNSIVSLRREIYE